MLVYKSCITRVRVRLENCVSSEFLVKLKLVSLQCRLLSLLFSLFALTTFAQVKPKVIPPSPKSAEYAKYTNYSVTLYNGLPDISIPLYSINLRGLTIPINLTYHASGIKYKQSSGEVGVGWNLNPGYRVSRTVHGYADEKESMPSNFSEESINDRVLRDKYLSRFLPLLALDRPFATNGQQLDGQYDIFNYNIPSEGGSFIISDRQNRSITTLEQSNVKVSFSTGATGVGALHGITGFRFNDENGSTFYFGKEKVGSLSSVLEFNNSDQVVPTAWALTDVTTASGESVKLSYTQYSEGGSNDSESTRISESYNPGQLNVDIISSEGPYVSPINSDTYTSFYLDEIESSREQVKFNRETTSSGTRIKSIDVFRSSGHLYKSVHFFYSSGSYHVFLDSIQIKDSENSRIESYKFEYYSKSVGNHRIFTADQWGYYLETDNVSRRYHDYFRNDSIRYDNSMQSLALYLPNLKRDVRTTNIFSLKAITYPTGGRVEYEYESNRYKHADRNEVSEGAGLRISSIKSDDYVHGETLIKNYVYGESESGYGLCILPVDYRDFLDETILFRSRGNIQLAGFPQRVMTYFSGMQGDIGLIGGLSGFVKYPAVTEYSLPSGHVERREKTIYKFKLGDPFGLNSYPVGNSWTGTPGFRMLYVDEYPKYISRYNFWDKPELSEKLVYSTDTDSLVKRETFLYSSSNIGEFTGIKVRPFVSIDTRDNEEYSEGVTRYYLFFNSFFKSGFYTIRTGKNLLIRKQEVDYTGSDSIVTTRTYVYNNKNQLAKESVNGSAGEELCTYYRYPQDIVSVPTTQSSASLKPVSYMVEQNMIGKPLEIVKTTIKAGDENITDVSLTSYKGFSINRSNNSFITSLPYKEYKLNLTKPISRASYIPFTINNINDEVNTIDPRLKSDLTFDQYDNNGNLQQYILRESPVSYKWGYNGMYPITEAMNARSNEVYYEGFEETGNTIMHYTGTKGYNGTFNPNFTLPNSKIYKVSWFSLMDTVWMYREQPYMGQNITGVIDDVRIFPAESHVSTFTYDHINGMTSSMDPKGLTTFYAYDHFGRLESISNGNKKILNRYKYNYANGAINYLSSERSIVLMRNNCPSGFSSSPGVKYIVPAGSYVSTISRSDANAMAEADMNANAQNYANNICECLRIYYSTAISASFSKNNCPSGASSGASVTYTVPFGKYTSTVSQSEADLKAQQDLTANGQTYANTHGSCALYLNREIAGSFTRNNCSSGYVSGSPISYTVPAGVYSSTISQADADSKAQNDVATNGQSYANLNGQCIQVVNFSIEPSMYSGTISRIVFTKPSEGYSETFNVINNGVGQSFQIPAGTYRVVFEMTADLNGPRYLNFSSNGGSAGVCNQIAGNVELSQLNVGGTYNHFTILDYCSN